MTGSLGSPVRVASDYWKSDRLFRAPFNLGMYEFPIAKRSRRLLSPTNSMDSWTPAGISNMDNQITAILSGIDGVDSAANEELIHRAYDDLRRIAAGHMRREGVHHTLQPTALVHEVWLKLEGRDSLPSWQDRGHFFAWASRAMANFLCDHARHKKCLKSGGDRKRISLAECDPKQGVDSNMGMIDVRDAIEELAKHEEARATILRLATFSGLSETEIAASMELSVAAVTQSLTASRMWLLAYLKG